MNVSEHLLSPSPTSFRQLLPAAMAAAASDPGTVPETFARLTSIT
jgi:hypothetical protein